ncbi:SDR family oxidoreductase, partial [Patescibacteria group bacterium]|nr:SDR family oxidoreductase [Patescibacteria group bacterium]
MHKTKIEYKKIFLCKNKVAVVTGGAGLIGREICRGLYNFGAKVYIADSDEKQARNIIKNTPINYIPLDIKSENSVQTMLNKIQQSSDKIDILVNCAYPKTSDWNFKFEKVIFKSWKENVNAHLGGYFLCCQKTAEIMKQQNGGSIINFGSIYGLVAPDFMIYEGRNMTMPVAYSAIKGGIIALTKYIATYYAKYNIRANVVSPGGVFNNQDSSFVSRYAKKTPLGKMAKPEDIVGAVIYLASDA